MKSIKGKICTIAGPTVVADQMGRIGMHATAYVGKEHLLGEVIKIDGELATIQVYEDTTGLSLGDEVTSSGKPLTAELGPGLLGNVFDGIQRPLSILMKHCGGVIGRGIHPKSLDREKVWRFESAVSIGDSVSEGDIIGFVEETKRIQHKIMVPLGTRECRIVKVSSGEFRVDEPLALLEDGKEIKMVQEWYVREARKHRGKLKPERPFITGQRVFDALFPLIEGGVAIVPGGFGTGKTIIQQTLARYAKADIIVYVGCGERGNEMTEVLEEFPKLLDPETGQRIIERTVLIVNTSNMPVAAREASIYTGVTIAEYYRDMGYHVAMMADSTSRWAEALREISSRLEELPGEEGFPPYLSTRMGNFYERAGVVTALGTPEREGTLTIIGAISPPGGDFSEPVTQASLRMAGTLWALDTELAYSRHFPAVSWKKSYSLYLRDIEKWLSENVSEEWMDMRRKMMVILQKEGDIRDIARLVGVEALQDPDRIVLELGEIIREVFLRQSVYNENDVFASYEKQFLMMKAITSYYERALDALEKGVFLEKILGDVVRERLMDMVNIPEDDFKEWAEELLSGLKKAFREEIVA